MKVGRLPNWITQHLHLALWALDWQLNSSWIPWNLLFRSFFFFVKNLFSDNSRNRISPNMIRMGTSFIIIGKMHFLLISENELFSWINCNGMTSLQFISWAAPAELVTQSVHRPRYIPMRSSDYIGPSDRRIFWPVIRLPAQNQSERRHGFFSMQRNDKFHGIHELLWVAICC